MYGGKILDEDIQFIIENGTIVTRDYPENAEIRLLYKIILEEQQSATASPDSTIILNENVIRRYNDEKQQLNLSESQTPNEM
jgi:hypothetical protein